MYSLGSVFSKFASKESFFTPKFIFFYSIVLAILFTYAVFWQQLLKKLPLTTAFANKSATVIWGMIWGILIFKEEIRITMIIGSVFILYGIYLVVNK